MNKIYNCNLQLFADGAVGGGEVAEGSATTVADTSQVAADTGATVDPKQADAERKANYKSMISGEYKDIHKEHMDKAFQRRFREKDKQIADLDAYKTKTTAAFDKLAIKYGVDDPSDIDKILAAMDKDNSYLEEYAMEHGYDIPTAAKVIEAERVMKQKEKQEAEAKENAEFNAKFNGWIQQAEQVKQIYPDFDFDYESTNEETGDTFRRLLNSGVPVETAYTVIHKNEIMGGAMQYAYTAAQREIADQRTSRMQRPIENGTSEQQASALHTDMSKLTKEQRQKIKAAVTRGEKVNSHNVGKYL